MAEKHLHGRDEPIFDPATPLIDTHHHLYVRPNIEYMLPEFLADVGAGHNIRASVYVETRFMSRRTGPEHLRPIGEVEFANGVGAMGSSGFFGDCQFAAAIVAHADLTLPTAQLEEYLDQAHRAAPERLTGIRQITMDSPDPSVFEHLSSPPRQQLLRDPRVRQNFRLLAARGLSFDAAIFHHQMPDLMRMADENPETTIILNHLGLALCPPGHDPQEVFGSWLQNLRALSERPNVMCKIGGLGAAYWGFGFHLGDRVVSSVELAEVWRPYIESAIDAFGPDRCMLESNYPPDGRSYGYVPLWNAFKRCLSGLSLDDKAAICDGTAARVYRIGAQAAPSSISRTKARTEDSAGSAVTD